MNKLNKASERKRRDLSDRLLRVEPLENRCMLSAHGFFDESFSPSNEHSLSVTSFRSDQVVSARLHGNGAVRGFRLETRVNFGEDSGGRGHKDRGADRGAGGRHDSGDGQRARDRITASVTVVFTPSKTAPVTETPVSDERAFTSSRIPSGEFIDVTPNVDLGGGSNVPVDDAPAEPIGRRPEAEAPRLDDPGNVPGFDRPDNSPSFDAPSFDAPSFDAPRFDAPRFDAPANDGSFNGEGVDPSRRGETTQDPIDVRVISDVSLDAGRAADAVLQSEARSDFLVSKYEAPHDLESLSEFRDLDHVDAFDVAERIRVPATNVEMWLRESLQEQDHLEQLDELLEAIASDRVLLETSVIDHSRPESEAVAIDAVTDRHQQDPAPGMILLDPGVEAFPKTGQHGADSFSHSDWHVGIGFFRTFEGLEVDRAARVSQTMPIVADPIQPIDEDASPSKSSRTVSQPTGRAMGVVVCLVGVHYLKNRRLEETAGEPERDGTR